MLASSRSVHGREFEVTSVRLWVFQRLSGLLLGPLVALHIWAPKMAAHPVLNALLLLVVLVHGYGGVRRIVMVKGRAAVYRRMAAAWCGVVAIAGALLVIAGA